MIVEEAETVVPAAEPAEAAAEVPVQTAEAEEEIQVPEGFDAAVLQAARATSACQHKNLLINSECEYTDTVKLDETYHVYTCLLYTSIVSLLVSSPGSGFAARVLEYTGGFFPPGDFPRDSFVTGCRGASAV